MSQDLYRVTLISGKTIDNLSFDEAMKYFFSHAGSTIKPWPVKEYKAP